MPIPVQDRDPRRALHTEANIAMRALKLEVCTLSADTANVFLVEAIRRILNF